MIVFKLTTNIIVNAFATYFVESLFSTKSEVLDLGNDNTSNIIVQLNAISEIEVVEMLSNLKDAMTSGPDKISSFLIKDCAMILAKPLTILLQV